ncbi:carboxylesterase, type B family protein, partial [Acanthamoeba castellanii str. Neff]
MLHTMVHKYSNPAKYLTYAQNVILHSTWQWVLPTRAQQQAASLKWAASKGCNQTTTAAVLACMRALPATSIVSTSGLVNYFQPSVDGPALQPVKNGDYNTDVNVIIGYNADEGNYMAFTRNGFRGPTAALTEADYIKSVYTTSLSYWLTSAQMDGIFNWYAGNTADVGY